MSQVLTDETFKQLGERFEVGGYDIGSDESMSVRWHQFVHNYEVRRMTKQPNLTAIIQ